MIALGLAYQHDDHIMNKNSIKTEWNNITGVIMPSGVKTLDLYSSPEVRLVSPLTNELFNHATVVHSLHLSNDRNHFSDQPPIIPNFSINVAPTLLSKAAEVLSVAQHSTQD